jgi:nascent polypeptide-associated complex subunit alpha
VVDEANTMFPGMNMNSKQMQQAMKKMGVQQEAIEAEQVIIRLPEGDMVFNNPDVAQVNMMGQETFQISGDFEFKERDVSVKIEEEDIETVMQQTHASREEVIEAIKQSNGDLAEAIMSLSSSADDIGDE